MRKRNLKVVSLLLIVVMLLNFLPASANATVSDADAQTSTGVTTVPNPDYVEPGSVRELESRREENVKHFLLPDNTVQAVVYADAVHRMDDSGNWQDISNDLSLTEYKGVKFYTTADERVVFAEKYAPNTQLWQLSENGYSIAMGMAQLQLSADATVTPIGGVTVTNAPVRRSATTWHSVEEARVVDNTASIVYANVKTNTDLEYIMIGNDIKENIVVKSRSNSYTYQFNITLTGLTAVLNENGSISLTDSVTGQQQYTIPAPYMVDAAGKRSNAVTYALKQTGEGQYTLTVTADSTWINAEDRVFPVKIDPSVSRIETADTYIDPYYPDENYGNSEILWVFDNSAALFRLDVPVLPSNAALISATLHISYYYHDSVNSGELYACLYQVLQPWGEYTHTWNAASNYYNYGISTTIMSSAQFSGSVGAYQSSPKWVEFDVTEVYENWLDGSENYGVAIMRHIGTNNSVILNSHESSMENRPYFTFTYMENRVADGVYKIQNIGNQFFLDVKENGYAAGTNIQQYYQKTGDAARGQLFKISLLKVEGVDFYYSIRPMTNSGMGLYSPLTGDDRSVTIEDMSLFEDEYSIGANQQWIIKNNGTYYTLRNGTQTQGGYLSAWQGTQVVTTNTFIEHCKWTLIPYTGDTIHGAFITNPVSEMTVGSHLTFNAEMYCSWPGVNGPPIFSVCAPDKSPTDKAIITSSGAILARKLGTVIVCVTYTDCPVVFEYVLRIKTNTCATVYAEVVYDQAYPNRYSNAVQRIINQMYALQEKYINEFDIWVEFSSPTEITSHADGCVDLGDSPTGTCSHATDQTCMNSVAGDINDYHHNNFSNNTERIISDMRTVDDQSRCFLIAYLGHDTCQQITERDQNDLDNDGDTNEYIVRHAINPYLGMAYPGCGLVVVSYGGEAGHTPQQWEIIETEVLMHEFGHLFDAPDHYGDNDVEEIVTPTTDEIGDILGHDDFNVGCIYGEDNRNPEILNNFTICDGCKTEIMKNKSRYNHTGW